MTAKLEDDDFCACGHYADCHLPMLDSDKSPCSIRDCRCERLRVPTCEKCGKAYPGDLLISLRWCARCYLTQR